MKIKPKIKAIIFDLGGVIMHGGYLPFIKHYCENCFTPQGKKKISELEHQVNLGTITEKKFYLEIQKIFHVELTPKQMHDIIVRKMQTNKSLVEFIPKIKKAKVALFTNSIGLMALEVLKLRKVNTSKVFDKVYVSSKIHLAKPDTRAYMYVIENLKVEPKEALLVDDRLENVELAQKLGMQGIVFKETSQFKKDLARFELI